jgi:dCMP deaminase
MERISKENYYLNIAQTVSSRGTCLRKRFGAIIVKNDVIISTGYTGAPRGRVNCCDRKTCLRDEMNIPRGERYELCRSVHAEANAIISASREQMLGADLYLACTDPKTEEIIGGTTSCQMCKRLVINAGIRRVIVRETEDTYTIYHVEDWITNDDSLGKLGY